MNLKHFIQFIEKRSFIVETYTHHMAEFADDIHIVLTIPHKHFAIDFSCWDKNVVFMNYRAFRSYKFSNFDFMKLTVYSKSSIVHLVRQLLIDNYGAVI